MINKATQYKLICFQASLKNRDKWWFPPIKVRLFGVSTPVFDRFLYLLESWPTSSPSCVSHDGSTTKFACGEWSCLRQWSSLREWSFAWRRSGANLTSLYEHSEQNFTVREFAEQIDEQLHFCEAKTSPKVTLNCYANTNYVKTYRLDTVKE